MDTKNERKLKNLLDAHFPGTAYVAAWLENLRHMPAVQWKLLNIRKLINQNPNKHAEQLKALEDRLGA